MPDNARRETCYDVAIESTVRDKKKSLKYENKTLDGNTTKMIQKRQRNGGQKAQ